MRRINHLELLDSLRGGQSREPTIWRPIHSAIEGYILRSHDRLHSHRMDGLLMRQIPFIIALAEGRHCTLCLVSLVHRRALFSRPETSILIDPRHSLARTNSLELETVCAIKQSRDRFSSVMLQILPRKACRPRTQACSTDSTRILASIQFSPL